MPAIFMTNRGKSTRPGNFLVTTRDARYEVGLDRHGEVQFVSYAQDDAPQVIVYRHKLPPSHFKKWVIAGSKDYSDLHFIRLTQDELTQKMKDVLYEYINEDIDEKVIGDNDRGMENFV